MTVATFADFTRGFRNSSASDTSYKNRKPTTKADNGDSETKRRQLLGQIAGIVQELHHLPEFTNTDRRLLNLSSAVAFLLAGR